jgi:AcrR family transcriptional regulator
VTDVDGGPHAGVVPAVGREAGGGRRSPRGRRARSTRRALLDGAIEVFAERGYERATIADIVERSGASVGSVYNLFGGKSELFSALFAEWAEISWAETSEAMDEARRAGATDPLAVYLAGARGYLAASWRHRRLARLFVAGDGPPGFAVSQRANGHAWSRRIIEVLHADHQRFGDVFTAAVNSVVGAGARHIIATCDSDDDVEPLVDYVLDLVVRLAGPDLHDARDVGA